MTLLKRRECYHNFFIRDKKVFNNKALWDLFGL